MARIVGGIGSSHAPSMAHAYDHQWSDKPEWKPLFEGSVPARRWLLEAAKPDAMVIFYNDHLNRFFFDAYPTFAIGVSEALPLADAAWTRQPFTRKAFAELGRVTPDMSADERAKRARATSVSALKPAP